MRKSRQEAAKTRERIIASAAAEFREHGITATGLADFMKAEGSHMEGSTGTSTVEAYQRELRHFLDWISRRAGNSGPFNAQKELLRRNPARGVQLPPQPLLPPREPSADER